MDEAYKQREDLDMLEIGTKAPAFTLPDQNGEMRSLTDYQGQKVILYFYPNKIIQKGVYAKMARGEMVRFMAGAGVEEPEQLATLRSIGCDYIQGYIWGRPLPPEEAEALVLNSFAA